ncbi:MAG: DUF885 domain-containing protein [Pseudomonadota bacterium]
MPLRRILKWLGAIAGVALVCASVLAINLFWFRPFSLNLFYEKVFAQFALVHPELLSQFGIAEQFGYRRHNAHLDDISVAAVERDFALWRSVSRDLDAYDYLKQTPSQQLSTRSLRWYVRTTLAGEPFRFHDYPVNQLFGVQSDTVDFLINQHVIADVRGARDYLSRIGEVPRKFDQLIEILKLRETRGIVPPKFVIERVLTQMRAFEASSARDNPLYTHLSERLGAIKLTGTDAAALEARCAGLIDSAVRPAFRKLITFFDAQLQRASTDDGVWKLPDGAGYYAWLLRQYTTTSLTPQEVHDLGLAEVARIEGEMRSLLESQNELRPGETVGQAVTRISAEPRFHYPNDDAGRETALTEYKRLLTEQLVLSRKIIGVSPKSPVDVRRVPPFKEKTSAGAYYTIPAIDGSRPGIFWANLRDMNAVTTYGMRTLSIHEGIPGHHFQLALQQEQQDVPTFRKVLPFTAYHEGWALYAEWLGTELGVYRDDPFGDLGRLQGEMHRAVRLVVDTGIHYKRWPREQAITYMQDKTGMERGEVIAEVERYIVLPGQACSYKIGMLRIQAARHRAEKALGAGWDNSAEKAFHDVVLGSGALPMEVLDEQVDAWIQSRVAAR